MSLHKSTLSLAATRRVNNACNSFEQAWRTGARPRIEDYLDRVAEAERNDLLRELIALDMDYRQKASEDPHPEDYQRRFPELDPAWLLKGIGFEETESAQVGESVHRRRVSKRGRP